MPLVKLPLTAPTPYRELTDKYQLKLGEGKTEVKRNRLRGNDKVRYTPLMLRGTERHLPVVSSLTSQRT